MIRHAPFVSRIKPTTRLPATRLPVSATRPAPNRDLGRERRLRVERAARRVRRTATCNFQQCAGSKTEVSSPSMVLAQQYAALGGLFTEDTHAPLSLLGADLE